MINTETQTENLQKLFAEHRLFEKAKTKLEAQMLVCAESGIPAAQIASVLKVSRSTASRNIKKLS